MSETSWTQDDITALEKAIAQGAVRVQFEDRMVEYRSLTEMKQTLAMIRDAVTGRKSKTHTSTYKSGPRPGFYPGPGKHRTGF